MAGPQQRRVGSERRRKYKQDRIDDWFCLIEALFSGCMGTTHLRYLNNGVWD